MKSKRKGMVVVQLNIDVIAEILSRLHVNDLIRFKSVCKSWFQLISSQQFIQLHLNRSRFRPIPIQRPDFNIHCCSADHLYGMNILSGISSDGLVCLFNIRNGSIHIWNPAIRSSACIPMKTSPPQIQCYWFGQHNGEYKLLLGTIDLEMHLVRPYNIGSSYDWQSTQKFESECAVHEEIGTLCNSSVHWPIHKGWFYDDNKRLRVVSTIMSYNLRQEKVGEILFPVDIPLEFWCIRLGVVDGSLSALFGDYRQGFELWAMKDYGYNESWTKLKFFDSVSTISINPEEEILDDPEIIKSPLCAKEVYVESLIYPPTERLGLPKNHLKPCQIKTRNAPGIVASKLHIIGLGTSLW